MISNLNEKTVDLDASLKSLGDAIDRRMEELDQLRDRLHLITLAALDRIDGDSSSDTAWSEIVGLAKGDVHWLPHAKANYPVTHAQLVKLSGELIERIISEIEGDDSLTEAVVSPSKLVRIADIVADLIEQDLLPEMFLAEDGRTFLRGQGKPYPVERVK